MHVNWDHGTLVKGVSPGTAELCRPQSEDRPLTCSACSPESRAVRAETHNTQRIYSFTKHKRLFNCRTFTSFQTFNIDVKLFLGVFHHGKVIRTEDLVFSLLCIVVLFFLFNFKREKRRGR